MKVSAQIDSSNIKTNKTSKEQKYIANFKRKSFPNKTVRKHSNHSAEQFQFTFKWELTLNRII
jgi:hypothetical protein